MPIPHPRRRRLGGGGLLDQGHVRDWAPPGWYWEVLPSGGRRLVRSQPVVDPILVWWRSRGPVMVPRLPDTAEVVRQRVSEETSTSVATWLCWRAGSTIAGRFSWISLEL